MSDDRSKENQRRAADPRRSAFVAANAGSGKTRVLTDRVARLLLSGVDPGRILCITYTKAAAAEMASRLFKLLGAWALADDAALKAHLEELEGDFIARTAEELAAARRLFARALETPGGLKIQTIHSFCESALQRFPLEAGVPPGFAVIDEKQAFALADAAIDAAAREDALGDAFTRLGTACSADAARAAIGAELASRQKIIDACAAAGGWSELRRSCARAIGASPDDDVDAIRAEAMRNATSDALVRAQAALRAGGKTCREFADGAFEEARQAVDPFTRYAALARALLTQKGTPRDKFPDKGACAADPWVGSWTIALQQAFLAAEERILAATNSADTDAFLRILEAALTRYERFKAARAALDYDDLIARACALFGETDAGGDAWVRYKLDQGLDHILLDEAQDTSPAQWKVVEGPLREFFAGHGARDGRRSFFAVGDQKQSIYSFQGADAGLFQAMRAELGKRAAAVAEFEDLPLTLSFRSAAPVLGFVDALFAEKAVTAGVTEDFPIGHGIERKGHAGSVELWPLAPRSQRKALRAWDAPLDEGSEISAPSLLAGEVAGAIAGWIASGEFLPSRGRPVRAGDFMILVQSRGPLFHEMIRALTTKGVPVAGADKILLLDDPAVEDLMSYARAALLATDDLALAETLRSPFFDVDEQSLYDLAQPRGEAEPLWSALARRRQERPEWTAAHDAIVRARAIGLRDGAYAFFSHLLETGAPTGRTRLYRRLGEASAEPVAEFLRQALEREAKAPRSLQDFVIWAKASAGEIKRDMEAASDAARVMTVHGAKGLEAEIVFLLDAHRLPATNKSGPLYYAQDDRRSVPVLLRAKGDAGAFALAACDRAKRLAFEEYRRLLYVAATRARDRLYVCGHEVANRKSGADAPMDERCWHQLAADAMDRLGAPESARKTSWGGAVRRIESVQTAAARSDQYTDERQIAAAPAFLFAPAAPERAPERLSPSRLSDDALGDAAFSPARSAEALARGRALHRLLELLPEVAPERRAAAGVAMLARLAPDRPEAVRRDWLAEAERILTDATFAPVFAPGSRAEVAIAGRPEGARPGVEIFGQIDRLCVEAGRVLIVDFKTNRPPPRRVEDVPQDYIAQLAAYRALVAAIYPGRAVEAALLWTHAARLMPIPAQMLDHAFARALT